VEDEAEVRSQGSAVSGSPRRIRPSIYAKATAWRVGGSEIGRSRRQGSV